MTLRQWLSSLVQPGRRVDRGNLRAGNLAQRRWATGKRGVLESLETREMFALDIVFDYSFDSNNFFDTAAKRSLLDLAASTYEGRITDNLTAITPGGSNTFTAIISNPSGSGTQNILNLAVPNSTLIVYVGAHDLGSSTLGQGGFGGYSVNGDQQFVDAVQYRGQTGVGSTDFAPWGGSIAFDTTGTNWYFGTSITGIANGQSDFLSVAIHELGHVLGFGTAPSFAAQTVGLGFTGFNAVNQYDTGGSPVPLFDAGHWAEGTKDGGFEASMDPTVTNGTRKTFTELDFGALADLGWTLTNHTPVLDNSGSPTLTTIAEDTANNPGTLVSALLTAAGGGSLVTDADPFAMKGIAVTATDTTNGTWEYTLNNGTQWFTIGSPSVTAARLLSNDPLTKIRFKPAQNFNGTVTAGITFKAWDQTGISTLPGGITNTTAGGATSAYSTAVETASITVTPVNDTPTNVLLSNNSVAENSANGTVVGTISAVDPDVGDTHTFTLNSNAGGRFAISGNQLIVANSALLNYEANTSHSIQITATDLAGQSVLRSFTINVTNLNEILGRRVFYNNSKFDGNSFIAEAADDAAIATDKVALLPGGTASYVNYTNYSRGINGVMIDVEHVAGSLSASDFQFRVGNDNNPAAWALAPPPTSIVVRTGAGASGSDRVELTWADGAITKTWLQVTVKATAGTGLSTADVFYFGNAIGETGDLGASAVVNATDEVSARNNPRTFLNPALVDNLYDYNRDGLVNATDQIIARSNSTVTATALKWISVPASFAAASAPAPQFLSIASPASNSDQVDGAVSTSAAPSSTPATTASSGPATVSSSTQSPIRNLVASAPVSQLAAAKVPASAALNVAAPSSVAGSTSTADASLRARLAGRARAVDTVLAQAPTDVHSTITAAAAVDWMAWAGQLRRSGR